MKAVACVALAVSMHPVAYNESCGNVAKWKKISLNDLAVSYSAIVKWLAEAVCGCLLSWLATMWLSWRGWRGYNLACVANDLSNVYFLSLSAIDQLNTLFS
jgi:hypothetical protein